MDLETSLFKVSFRYEVVNRGNEAFKVDIKSWRARGRERERERERDGQSHRSTKRQIEREREIEKEKEEGGE